MTEEILQSVDRLSKDLANAARELTPDEVRYLVDQYYAMQKQRIRAGNQVRAMSEVGEPHDVVNWLSDQSTVLENQIKRALGKYVDSNAVGQWCTSIKGIGPILTAGLLAHIDINKAPTVGHIWRFAGLDPTVSWNKGQKRPWNARLKSLCYLIGESFVKVSGSDDAYYGQVFLVRKALEINKNINGDYEDQAHLSITNVRFGADTDARLWMEGRMSQEAARQFYEAPSEQRQGLAKKLAGPPGSGPKMLPPARIHRRAARYAVKLFLAHLHHVWYKIEFKKDPPLPYAIEHLGHAHYIPPP